MRFCECILVFRRFLATRFYLNFIRLDVITTVETVEIFVWIFGDKNMTLRTLLINFISPKLFVRNLHLASFKIYSYNFTLHLNNYIFNSDGTLPVYQLLSENHSWIRQDFSIKSNLCRSCHIKILPKWYISLFIRNHLHYFNTPNEFRVKKGIETSQQLISLLFEPTRQSEGDNKCLLSSRSY